MPDIFRGTTLLDSLNMHRAIRFLSLVTGERNLSGLSPAAPGWVQDVSPSESLSRWIPISVRERGLYYFPSTRFSIIGLMFQLLCNRPDKNVKAIYTFRCRRYLRAY